MRQSIRQKVRQAARPTSHPDPEAGDRLGAEVVRLARVATSLHLTQAAGLLGPRQWPEAGDPDVRSGGAGS